MFLRGFLAFSLLFSMSCFADLANNTATFIREAFPSGEPSLNAFWLKKDLKALVESRFDYRFQQLRIRYWGLNNETVWVLEEVGKEQPITFGVHVVGDHINNIKVLAYRESRGGEIQHDFFMRQFDQARLVMKKSKTKLDKRIDGITGATLSVQASKKIAKLALFLHQQTPYFIHAEI